MDNKTHKAYSFISHLLTSDNFKSNIASVALGGTGFQLIALILYLLIKPSLGYHIVAEIFFVLLITTLLGAAATLYILNILTAPVSLVAEALDDFLNKKKLPDLAGDFTDEAGKMMAQVQQLMMTTNTLQNAIEKSSFRDHLTGVYNRYWCEAQLLKEVERLRYEDESMSIVVIDIDGLTSINNLYGHTAGDWCLKHLANTLRFNVRGTDCPMGEG